MNVIRKIKKQIATNFYEILAKTCQHILSNSESSLKAKCVWSSNTSISLEHLLYSSMESAEKPLY